MVPRNQINEVENPMVTKYVVKAEEEGMTVRKIVEDHFDIASAGQYRLNVFLNGNAISPLDLDRARVSKGQEITAVLRIVGG